MKIFVGNLPTRPDLSEFDLRRHFEKCGRVIEVQIRRDRNGFRSFGFVVFENDDDARTAVQQLNGAILDGCRLEVRVAHRQ